MFKSVSQILAEPVKEPEGPSKQPHPDSLEGPRVAWCKLSAEDQLFHVENERFEERLAGEIQRRRAQGATVAELEHFARVHRGRWVQSRNNVRKLFSRVSEVAC